MLCALCGSALWVNNASRLGWAVSTSHSIVGATIGVGIAFRGVHTVQWGDATHGVGAIILSWFISPLLAAGLACAIFLLTKQIILKHDDSHARLLRLYPAYVTATFSVVIFFMVLAGAPALKLSYKDAAGKQQLSDPGAVVGIWVALSCVVYACAWKGKQTAWFQRYIDSIPFAQHDGEPHGRAAADAAEAGDMPDGESAELLPPAGAAGKDAAPASSASAKAAPAPAAADPAAAAAAGGEPPGAGGWVDRFKALAVSGLDQDMSPQDEAAKVAHDLAVRYDPLTERLFSAVQVFTAAFASLAHGSNDVANAVAPMSVIQSVWFLGGSVVSASAPTPLWCLAYGGFFIDLGLVLMGYRVMRSLGNNITYHSPSRGFSMELGALTTVLFASATGAVVSTTHCITGATVGVGLCTGQMAGVNWKMARVCRAGFESE